MSTSRVLIRGQFPVLGVAAAVLFVAGAIALLRFAAPTPVTTPASDGDTATPQTLPAADAERLMVSVEPVADPSEYVAMDAAIAAAEAVWGTAERPSPDAYLQFVTDPHNYAYGQPITRMPLWLVRYEGLERERRPGLVLHYAYVFVDAVTGEAIGRVWRP